MKAIIGFRTADKVWHIKIDGKVHPSDFSSRRDIELWHGAMKEGGLYRDCYLVFDE